MSRREIAPGVCKLRFLRIVAVFRLSMLRTELCPVGLDQWIATFPQVVALSAAITSCEKAGMWNMSLLLFAQLAPKLPSSH